jgi:hypothetical protein
VFIANSDLYWRSTRFEFGSSDGTLTSESSGKVQEYAVAMNQTVRTLQRYGHQVVLVQTVPQWGADTATWEPQLCSWFSVMERNCGAKAPLADFYQSNSPVSRAILEIGNDTEADVWDSSHILCPEEMCSTMGPGFTRYRDSGHLSVPQAQALSASIESMISRDD